MGKSRRAPFTLSRSTLAATGTNQTEGVAPTTHGPGEVMRPLAHRMEDLGGVPRGDM
jgi:hypothetical protein